MGKDRVILDRETYEKLMTLRDSISNYYMEHYDKYQERCWKEIDENKKLQKENGYLKALFDKEGDTQVVKYNGRLYRIVSMTHYKAAGEEENLDITTVPVIEVG